jgi:type IV secretory pathway VirB2 component (pilin)
MLVLLSMLAFVPHASAMHPDMPGDSPMVRVARFMAGPMPFFCILALVAVMGYAYIAHSIAINKGWRRLGWILLGVLVVGIVVARVADMFGLI